MPAVTSYDTSIAVGIAIVKKKLHANQSFLKRPTKPIDVIRMITSTKRTTTTKAIKMLKKTYKCTYMHVFSDQQHYVLGRYEGPRQVCGSQEACHYRITHHRIINE